jgi:hypothetical protein
MPVCFDKYSQLLDLSESEDVGPNEIIFNDTHQFAVL